MAGSRWRLSRNRRRKPPLSPTYAPSSRSTRSGHWRWVGSCSPPSALRRRPGRRTRPWCTKSSVPSAAPLYDVRVTPQGPDPRPTTGPATTTATRATNVRARTSAATSSTSPDPSTSAPPAPAAEPHQQHAADATRTTGGPAPSGAGTPQSPRQERASKRAAQRQPTQRHAATGSRGDLASPARSGALPGPTNTGAVGTQPGQPPGTAHPHRVPAPSPTRSPQPLTPPVPPAHGPRPAASQAATTQAHPKPRPHHGAPDQPAADPTYAPTDKSHTSHTQGRNGAADPGPPPPTRGPDDDRHASGSGVGHEPQRPRPGRPRPTQPLVQPNNARPRNMLRHHLSTGHTSGDDVHLPSTHNGHPRSGG